MSVTDNAALTRRLYEAFNRGDLEGAAAMATDHVEVDLVPMGHVFRGRQEFRDGFMGGFKRAFPDIQLTIVNQVTGGEYVVNECTWNGRHTGPLAGPNGDIPPTGKSVNGARICEVWRVENGKLARLTNYQDAAAWMRQLGLAS
jgi:steroid delta-isomerase-like uncharacterized protein